MAGIRKFPPPYIGQVFEKLTVINLIYNPKSCKLFVECKCECGKIIISREDSLRIGNCKSCGCIARLSIKDEIYGELTAIKFVGQHNNGKSIWLFSCSCGNLVEKNAVQVRAKNARQHCGCKNVTEATAAFNALYCSYREAAFARGLEFCLSKDEFTFLTKNNCYYCNSFPMCFIKRKHFKYDYRYNGIDRNDNTKGYTLDNSVTCCKICNIAKSTYTEEYFFDWVKRISLNLKNKGKI